MLQSELSFAFFVGDVCVKAGPRLRNPCSGIAIASVLFRGARAIRTDDLFCQLGSFDATAYTLWYSQTVYSGFPGYCYHPLHTEQ